LGDVFMVDLRMFHGANAVSKMGVFMVDSSCKRVFMILMGNLSRKMSLVFFSSASIINNAIFLN
jgi:hypothetical protein